MTAPFISSHINWPNSLPLQRRDLPPSGQCRGIGGAAAASAALSAWVLTSTCVPDRELTDIFLGIALTGKQLARKTESAHEQPHRGLRAVVTPTVAQRDAWWAKPLGVKALIRQYLRRECVGRLARDAGRGICDG